jgi:multiple sugar transport system substrate-binding protein
MVRRSLVAFVVLALVAAACTSGGGDSGAGGESSSNAGPVELVMWQGYTPPPPVNEAYEYTSLSGLVDEFNKAHPDIHVTVRYVNSDFALQKLTVALQGNEQPDISYQYGSNMAQVATTPKVVDLTDRVNGDADFNWEDFFPAERAAATVDGRVLGIPALVDNLAVVYNKDLFAQAGLDEPTPDWTWDDLEHAATTLTDTANKQFGLAFPMDGSETTVWQFEAMLWEAGGDILNSDNTQAVFNSEAGVKALTTLQRLANAGALYEDFHPDAGKMEELFNSGNVGMIITGPWDLASFPDVDYGVQIMPSFDDPTNHQSIAGPDNWVIFDNGPEHVDAAWEFLSWFTAPEQLARDSMATGHLPTRASVEALPAFKGFDKKYPGVGTFVENLENVEKARPVLAAYPQVSEALGQAVVKAVLGQAQPQEALDAAAKEANGILAVPA